MTNTLRMLSNLSCMFTLWGDRPSKVTPEHDKAARCNFDWQDGFALPALELAQGTFNPALEFGPATQAEFAYRSLRAKLETSKADIATMAKQYRGWLTDRTMEALATSNRPDAIPADLKIMRVTSWEPEKRVFIPLPAAKGATLAEIVKANRKPDGFMVNLPMRPIGHVLGEVSAEAWRKGEALGIALHTPKPLPAYQVPTRELTAGEKLAAEWLAQPGRTVTTSKVTSRLNRLMARFWDKGDGHQGLQPVMDSNAAHRAIGRINRAIRFNATVSA